MRSKCTCEDCGKVFESGTEGDNEIYCLRCEYVSIKEVEADGDYEGDEDEI